eukprot:15416-Heterococcus_DN1.PRE.1
MPPGGHSGSSPTHRLSLKDIAPLVAAAKARNSIKLGDREALHPVQPSATATTTVAAGQQQQQPRRPSFHRFGAGAHTRRFESLPLEKPQDESFTYASASSVGLDARLRRKTLDSWWFNGFVLLAAAAEVALYFKLHAQGDTSLIDLTDPLRASQMAIAAGFLLELCVRLYAFGLSYFSGWSQ